MASTKPSIISKQKDPTGSAKRRSMLSAHKATGALPRGASYMSMHRGSISLRQPALRYMPTYRLEPKTPLNREVCENIMKRVMEQVLEDYQYTSKYAQILCKNLSEEIKTRVKIHGFDRYKLICIVTIGEKYMQGYNSVVAFLWDADRDGYISCVHDTPNYFAVATLYYCYYD